MLLITFDPPLTTITSGLILAKWNTIVGENTRVVVLEANFAVIVSVYASTATKPPDEVVFVSFVPFTDPPWITVRSRLSDAFNAANSGTR